MTAPMNSPAICPEQQGRGGDGDARMGLVKRLIESGQQVLGTCSPADLLPVPLKRLAVLTEALG